MRFGSPRASWRWLLALWGAALGGLAGCGEPASPTAVRHDAAPPPLGSRGPAGADQEAAAPSHLTPAAFELYLSILEERVPAGFSVVVEPPFVVVGDEPSDVVAARAEHTVRWAAQHLEAQLFRTPPRSILEVWLFKDDRSYRSHAKSLFGHDPETPYGYYSPTERVLLMNIGTGGGTLVHEMVHPYVEADFPDCPAWINEGLGSLYEQSAERGGRMVGLTNWRLAGLKDAIREDAAPSFRQLAGLGDAFYDDDRGVNYATARYLFLYLQEQGLLERFYAGAREAHDADPTGYRTLVDVLGGPDMAELEHRWRSWVLTLEFPG
jgi:hypothetical protein